MPQPSRPRKGSMGFSPRKRVAEEILRIKPWPSDDGFPTLQGFAGYKAGMTHVMMVNDEADLPHEGMEESVPVTVAEMPPMHAVAPRVYEQAPYGVKPQTEVWAGELHDELDRIFDLSVEDTFDSDVDVLREVVETGEVDDPRVTMHTALFEPANVPKKKPDVMETRVDGGSTAGRASLALDLVVEGGEYEVSDVFRADEYPDAAGVTKGKGTQSFVKRWGVQRCRGKHAHQGWRRRTGNLSPWNPSRVRSTVPQLGQTGYRQRTEFNKRPINPDEGGDASTEDGLVNYGEVDSSYAFIKGLLPGPNKRLLRFRPAIRPNDRPRLDPEVRYVSTASNQG